MHHIVDINTVNDRNSRGDGDEGNRYEARGAFGASSKRCTASICRIE